jgi:hypothetical protein
MKIRSGFVSNSSSSSFAIFGKIYDKDALIKFLNLSPEEIDDIDENGLYDYVDAHGYAYECLSDDGEYLIGKQLYGKRENIIGIMTEVEDFFGKDCKLYVGINQDGNVQLDL